MDDEFVMHAALVEWFRRFRQDGVVFFHPSSGEERTKRVHPKTGKVFCPGGTRLQRMGMRKGVPDLVILHFGRIIGSRGEEPRRDTFARTKRVPGRVGTGGRDLCRGPIGGRRNSVVGRVESGHGMTTRASTFVFAHFSAAGSDDDANADADAEQEAARCPT